MKELFSIMPNLQTHYHFKLDFQNQNVDQHTGGKWLITAPKTTRTISCKDWNSLENILVEDLNMT